MKGFRKKLAIGFGIFFLVIILTLVIIAAFFEQQIGNRLLTEINKQLKSELKISDFDLSLLSGFPNASVNLRQIVLEDSSTDTLLRADNVSFRFGLLSLFGSSIKVRSVVIENGALYINIDKNGKGNYNILLEEEETTSSESSDFAISLEEARFKNVRLRYKDERSKQEMSMLINEGLNSGEFSNDDFSLTSFANIKTDFVELSDGRYFVGKDIDYDAKINVDFTEGTYEFEDVNLGIESNVFKVGGLVQSKSNYTDFDLILTSKEGSVESMVQLLPEEYLSYFGEINSRGRFVCNGTVNGRLNEKESPAINAKLSLTDGYISSDKLANALKDVEFTARFTNGENPSNKSTIFDISDFKGYFNRELIESKLRISDLDDPKIDFVLDGVLPLGSMYGLFNSPSITDGDGEIEIKNLRLKGRYEDMLSTSRIDRVQTSGIIEFDDAELKINKERLTLDKGMFKLMGNSLVVKDVELEGAGNDLKLNGTFLNVLPVLFADSLNSKKAELKFNATLTGKELDIDRLVAISDIQIEEGDVEEEVMDSLKVAQTQSRERFTNFLKGTFRTNIEEFNYNKINGTSLSAIFEFDNNELKMKGGAMAMKGEISMDGKVFFKDRPYLRTKIEGDQIDVKEFFRQNENFGQELLQDKHIKGKLDTKFLVKAYWDEEGNFLMDKLNVLGDVGIKDGELVRYEMLYDFSDYIKIRDLRHIKFQHLYNVFEIKKQTLYLPAMFIQSNALNLTVSGQQSFDYKMDYNVKVNAAQVIFNKFKKYDAGKGAQKAKKKGWFNIYYHVFGTVDKYKMESDRRGVKKRFARSDHHRREIRAILKKEFGSVATVNEPKEWLDNNGIPEFDDSDGSDDADFIEGWDDEEEEETTPKKQAAKTNTAQEEIIQADIPEEDYDGEEEFIDFEDGGY